MVIFLSVQEIEKVVEKLINGGYPKTTPIAVIYKATWPDEKVVKGTLEDIASKVKENDIKKTALIMVGEFLGQHIIIQNYMIRTLNMNTEDNIAIVCITDNGKNLA